MSTEEMIEDFIQTVNETHRAIEMSRLRMTIWFSTGGVALLIIGYLLYNYNLFGWRNATDFFLTAGILYVGIGTLLNYFILNNIKQKAYRPTVLRKESE